MAILLNGGDITKVSAIIITACSQAISLLFFTNSSTSFSGVKLPIIKKLRRKNSREKIHAPAKKPVANKIPFSMLLCSRKNNNASDAADEI